MNHDDNGFCNVVEIRYDRLLIPAITTTIMAMIATMDQSQHDDDDDNAIGVLQPVDMDWMC